MPATPSLASADARVTPARGNSPALSSTVALLKAHALAGAGHPALHGRNIGLVCDQPERPEAFLLQRLAIGLGARVALVCPGLDEAATAELDRAGRMLGRLYDALVCVDVPARIVDRLRATSGVPAITDLTGEWIRLRTHNADADGDGRLLLQALLVGSCA